MKFIADVMLGRLAKRMRLMGCDVYYACALTDNQIIRLSLEQDRIILTRDTGLVMRPLAAKHAFINSEQVQEQLEQILSAFPDETQNIPFTRCSICNEPLISIEKSEVKDRVPHYIYEGNISFLQCPRCARIYWRGTHIKKITILKA